MNNPDITGRQVRRAEELVSWTRGERLRFLCYRLRLTVREMNHATRRLLEHADAVAMTRRRPCPGCKPILAGDIVVGAISRPPGNDPPSKALPWSRSARQMTGRIATVPASVSYTGIGQQLPLPPLAVRYASS